VTKRKTVERGYGETHRRLRRHWAPAVATGGVLCSRCGRYIRLGEPWDLGHDDEDRSRWSGPEHRACNRATSGRVRVRGVPPPPPDPRDFSEGTGFYLTEDGQWSNHSRDW
jgi:hypothetical protein